MLPREPLRETQIKADGYWQKVPFKFSGLGVPTVQWRVARLAFPEERQD
jgi:hypothetical protein